MPDKYPDAVPVMLVDTSKQAYVASAGSGSVVVSNFPATQPVSGTVGVSGTVTVGTHAVTQSGTWNVGPASAGTSVVTQVNTSTASATLATASSSRFSVIIYNAATVNLLVKFGATASATSYTTQVTPGGTLVVPRDTYSGIIDGILASGAAATAQVTVVS